MVIGGSSGGIDPFIELVFRIGANQAIGLRLGRRPPQCAQMSGRRTKE